VTTISDIDGWQWPAVPLVTITDTVIEPTGTPSTGVTITLPQS
jgi:hypothetical protein